MNIIVVSRSMWSPTPYPSRMRCQSVDSESKSRYEDGGGRFVCPFSHFWVVRSGYVGEGARSLCWSGKIFGSFSFQLLRLYQVYYIIRLKVGADGFVAVGWMVSAFSSGVSVVLLPPVIGRGFLSVLNSRLFSFVIETF